MFYLYDMTETDGNDATRFDIIIEATSREVADKQLSEHFAEVASARDWESDGNFCGYFFPCDCKIPSMPDDDDEFPCDECNAVAINGINCHETGCPAAAELDRVEHEVDNFECQGHGGLIVNDYYVREFATIEEAENALSSYHLRYYV